MIPADIPDSRLCEPVPLEQITGSFGGLESLKLFTIPSLGTDSAETEASVEKEKKGTEASIEKGEKEKKGKISCGDIKTGPLPPGWRGLQARQALFLIAGGAAAGGSGPAGSFLRAYHTVQWRRESVFCGTCGTRNGDASNELARVCPVCGRHEYPRISPAVIVLIINDQGKALLAHNRNFTAGVYSLIAGFNEAGENLEDTIDREIREEVGLEVRDIRYITSQPWPFPNSLMLGFTARYAGGTIKADGVEIEDARWFDRDHLPDLPGKGSISRYIINLWIEGNL